MIPERHEASQESFDKVEQQVRDAWSWCKFLREQEDWQADIAIDDATVHLEKALNNIHNAMRRLGYLA